MKPTKLNAVIAFLFCSTLCLVSASASTPKDKNKLPKDRGEVRVQTTPAGFPIMIDGQSYGVSNNPADPIRLTPGTHHVEVLFPGKPWAQDVVIEGGKRNCICLTYARTPLYSPCPYHPSVTVDHDRYGDGEVITFTSDVSYTGTRPLTYSWTVSPANAKIVGPTDSTTLQVDTTGLGGQRVTAALTVNPGYGDERCTARGEGGADVQPIPPVNPPTGPHDQLNFLSFDADKARLDLFAIELQNHPDSDGYLVYYGGKQSRPNEFDKYTRRSINYLVESRGIDRRRVKILRGGDSDTAFIEMWLVPPGAEAPAGTPVNYEHEQTLAPQTRTRRVD
jgi:hypothetical protein